MYTEDSSWHDRRRLSLILKDLPRITWHPLLPRYASKSVDEFAERLAAFKERWRITSSSPEE